MDMGLHGLHRYWATTVARLHRYGVAQVLGCTGTELHTDEAAHLRGCTSTGLHRYGATQIFMGLHAQLGATQPFKMGPTQPKINLYSMRRILWPVPDTYTALIQLCGFSVQEKLAVQLKHTGMPQACAFSSVPGMYFFRSGTSMLQFRIIQE